jgi:hypothetical protein
MLRCICNIAIQGAAAQRPLTRHNIVVYSRITSGKARGMKNVNRSIRIFKPEPPKVAFNQTISTSPALIFMIVMFYVFSDFLIVLSPSRNKALSLRKILSNKIFSMVLEILYPAYYTLSFYKSDYLRNCVLWRYQHKHNDMVRHQMPFTYHTLFLLRQLPQYLTRISAQLPI